mmetsp:Transcript_49421/g.112254  ORF Transcript_49421/g.112254 Transcript_49421/m.112254 type:complete len:91 (+) Transcript_49421:168-440(+)
MVKAVFERATRLSMTKIMTTGRASLELSVCAWLEAVAGVHAVGPAPGVMAEAAMEEGTAGSVATAATAEKVVGEARERCDPAIGHARRVV